MQKRISGSIEYLDSGRTILVMTPFLCSVLFVNARMVESNTCKSYKDLLYSKWSGKLVIDDPRDYSAPAKLRSAFFTFTRNWGWTMRGPWLTRNPSS